jgi:hypothetical protein
VYSGRADCKLESQNNHKMWITRKHGFYDLSHKKCSLLRYSFIPVFIMPLYRGCWSLKYLKAQNFVLTFISLHTLLSSFIIQNIFNSFSSTPHSQPHAQLRHDSFHLLTHTWGLMKGVRQGCIQKNWNFYRTDWSFLEFILKRS